MFDRLSSVVILISVLAAMAGFAIAPLIALHEQDAQIEHKRDLLAALRLQLARLSDPAGDAGTSPLQLNPVRPFLSGDTTGLAGAELQKAIGDLVGTHAGRVSRFQTLPPQPDEGLTRLSLSFSMRIDIDGLRALLHRLETGAPAIFIDDIEIQAPELRGAEQDPYFRGPLDVTMQVSGFMPLVEEL